MFGNRGRLLALMLLVASLSACASVPTSGPVRVVGASQAPVGVDGVGSLGREPRPGATQAEIVEGFLNANGIPAQDYALARKFLVENVRESWNPRAGTVVYDDSAGNSVRSATPTSLLFGAPQDSVVSERGALTPSPTGARVLRGFGLVKVSGEWRIQDVQPGLLLTRRDFTRLYQAVDLYYLNPGGDVLVPDTVMQSSDRPGQVSKAVQALLRGPTPTSAASTTSAFPARTALTAPAVPVDGQAVARIDLTDEALQADDAQRRLMSAQLTWTATQFDNVRAVAITVAGQPFSVPGVGAEQTRETWGGLDPNGIKAGAPGFVVTNGRLEQVTPDGATPVAGILGSGSVTPTRAAVTLEADAAAFVIDVAGAAGTVYTATLADGSRPIPRARVGAVSSLSYDRLGNVWIADRAKSSLVEMLRPTGSVVTVPLSGVTGVVQRVRVARDGTRAALVVRTSSGAALYLAQIQRSDGGVRLIQARRVEQSLIEVGDVAWLDADRLIVLARTASSTTRGAFTVRVGSATVDPQGAVIGMLAVAAAPGSPSLTQAGASISQYTGGRWDQILRGATPVYPG